MQTPNTRGTKYRLRLSAGGDFVLAAPEQESNCVNSCQSYDCENNTAGYGSLPAENCRNQVILEKSYESPVDGAYNDQ